jgi:oligopeptide/dipeptide ABC transporter ATP-binding protein
MKSVPIPDPRQARAIKQDLWLKGDMPSPFNPPRGCIFHSRCPYLVQRCQADVPALRRMENGDWVACHRAEELDLSI